MKIVDAMKLSIDCKIFYRGVISDREKINSSSETIISEDLHWKDLNLISFDEGTLEISILKIILIRTD